MKRILLLITLSAFITVSAFSQADLQPAATVNLIRNEPITVRQLRTEVTRMETTAGRALSQEERLKILDTMINEKLALQAAERDRTTVSENEINQHLQQLKGILAQQIGRQPTDAEFSQAIRNESGLDLPAFREQLRKQMIVQKYLMAKKGNLINSIRTPTEADITEQFELIKAQLVRPETIRFSMIQVPFGPDAASKTKARELADELVREIGSNPSKFDEVVTRGQSPNAGFMAGDGGYIPRNPEALNVVGQNFINTAFSLKQGEVSNIIEGNPGWQIIKVTENYAMKNLTLDDIMQLGTRMTVRDYIGNVILQQRQQDILVQASQELAAELRAGRNFQIFEKNLNW